MYLNIIHIVNSTNYSYLYIFRQITYLVYLHKYSLFTQQKKKKTFRRYPKFNFTMRNT